MAEVALDRPKRFVENLFRRTPGVLPAPGKIKNVDFFVDDFPFDLKVTYLPKEYAASVRKQQGVADPMKLLRSYAKQRRIAVSADAAPEQERYEIIERMKDSGEAEAKSVLSSVADGWSKVVRSVMDDKWASGFKRKNSGSMLTKFTFKSRQYETYADVIFAVKESSR